MTADHVMKIVEYEDPVSLIPRLHDEAGSTSARRALVEPARRASFIV